MPGTSVIRSWLLNLYVHRLPPFRGKWRLLRPFAPVLDGTPVRSSYGDVHLGFDVGDRTHLLGLSGKYGERVANEVKSLRPGDCFIDVGANCGVFSLLAAERVGPDGLVMAFEPCFGTFTKLVRNIGLNGLGNVLPFNMALSSLTRPDLLDNSSAGHSGRFAIAHAPVETGERIMSLSITDFPGLLAFIDDRPVTVKIDVEGFEYAALRGLAPILALPQTRGVVVEIDDRNLGRYGSSAEAIFGLLRQHGFTRAGPHETGQHFDAIFHRNPAAARLPAPAAARRRHRSPGIAAAPPARRAPRPAYLPRAAAAMLALATGWFAFESKPFVKPAQAEENFVEEALQSFQVAEMRQHLRRSPAATFNAGEVGSSARIALPILPAGWRITDVQLFPSDSGPSLHMIITNGKSRPISLFAIRDDHVAPAQPAVLTRDGKTVAYWQEGDLAYALISKRRPPAELDRLAEDIADNVTS
ncbi:putative transmembrane transcriptional regulator (Anti-sigma factor) [Sphingomonas paucimobilis]|uniref:FkbM family methyltransferase n=1 Tax=Sphingobium sp. DC-2 TaxID=1303256 RepID=UPI000449FEC0|nr:FkbM family methyltransferase [Sphingobium sp. DC-2]EZP70433.1 putative transmembrane transcriptional regulator (Anti-sigma factor) [Sphingomonas paucimobilis]